MSYTWKDAEQYIILYDKSPEYGSTGIHRVRHVKKIISSNNYKSLWDFGCGRNYVMIKSLRSELPEVSSTGYDPAITNSEDGVSNVVVEGEVDIITSIDCLEHLHEDELPQCFEIFLKKSPKYIYLDICTRLAGKILPDGTNAHKTVKPDDWWKSAIERAFPQYSIDVYNTSKFKDHVEIGIKRLEVSK